MDSEHSADESLDGKNPIQFRRIRLDTDIERELFKRALLSTSAHVQMLKKTGIIPQTSATRILEALDKVKTDLSSSKEVLGSGDADVYDALDKKLRALIGDEFVLSRTAKSHNDQASTDL